MGGVNTVTNKSLFVAAAVHTLLLHVVGTPNADGDPKLGATAEACNATLYHELCVETLGPFSQGPHSTPYLWARAGVVVTIWEVRALSRYIRRVKNSGKVIGPRLVSALNDCVDLVDDVIDQLQDSLQLLRNLDPTKFQTQMSDINSWLSATLSDEDTCIDGINEGGGGALFRNVENKVTNSSQLTSNALALVNKLASSGSPL